MPSNKIDISEIRDNLLKNRSISIPIKEIEFYDGINVTLLRLNIPDNFIVISYFDDESLNFKINLVEKRKLMKKQIEQKETLFYLSVQGYAWGVLRNIHTQATEESQRSKMAEEAQELKDALAKNDYFEILDAVGDIWQCFLMINMIRHKGSIVEISELIECLTTMETDDNPETIKAIDLFIEGKLNEGNLIMIINDTFGMDFINVAYQKALETIKPRRGTMIAGKFVKEE